MKITLQKIMVNSLNNIISEQRRFKSNFLIDLFDLLGLENPKLTLTR
jgi:hypothetical protein